MTQTASLSEERPEGSSSGSDPAFELTRSEIARLLGWLLAADWLRRRHQIDQQQ